MNQTKPKFDLLQIVSESGRRMEAIQRRYDPLFVDLRQGVQETSEMMQANPGSRFEEDVHNGVLDRYMRLGKRRHQENLRAQADLDSYDEFHPRCSCGKSKGAWKLGSRCAQCTTEVRYTVQQEYELSLEGVQFEAARRQHVQEIYVRLVLRDRLVHPEGSLCYEPRTTPVKPMPRLRGPGRLWEREHAAQLQPTAA